MSVNSTAAVLMLQLYGSCTTSGPKVTVKILMSWKQ